MAFNPETVPSWSKRCSQQGRRLTELRPEMNHFPRRTEEGSGVCGCGPRGPKGSRSRAGSRPGVFRRVEASGLQPEDDLVPAI
jgi:hypothetical protein